jgi:hypothetical protein
MVQLVTDDVGSIEPVDPRGLHEPQHMRDGLIVRPYSSTIVALHTYYKSLLSNQILVKRGGEE